MPELPNVETFRRYLDATSLHKRINRVECADEKVLDITPQRLGQALVGRQLIASRRRGKHLLVELDRGGWLALHFGMTGYLRYFKGPSEDREAAFDAVRILFDNGFALALNTRRKLARLRLTDDPDRYATDHGLGPDALELPENAFVDLLDDRRGSIKSFLMNQALLAGIGNEYSDEILFQAGIHPTVTVDRLDSNRRHALYTTLRDVLERAVECGGEPTRMPDDFLLPHRGAGERCPRCSAPLKHIKVAGRSAFVCERCQPPA